MQGLKYKYMFTVIWMTIFTNMIGCHTGSISHEEHNKNAAKITTVADKFAWQALVYDSTKKYIYLSFDDGPQHGTCRESCVRNKSSAANFG